MPARLLLLILGLTLMAFPSPPSGSPLPTAPPAATNGSITLHYFWGVGCPHCARAKPFLKELQQRHPRLRIETTEVLKQRDNIPRLMEMARQRGEEPTGVPVFIIDNRVLSGFSDSVARDLEQAVTSLENSLPAESVKQSPSELLPLPTGGTVDPASLSLPVMTVVIAGLDSFNPCAFFVLLFLLSLLVHAHSRFRMVLIGTVFVLCSGLIYFLFMAAWLNLFLLAGHLALLTTAAGVIAVLIALINIKDFFLFAKGVSLVIPEEAKPGLFARMRRLVRADSLPTMLAGTLMLSVAANAYELLCTAGFPMVFTRLLTLHNLPQLRYYFYLAFYNTVYVIPLAIIVAVFTATLGSRKLTEWQGRVLKLLSGTMMLGLGTILLVDPSLLNSARASILLFAASVAVSLGLAAAMYRFSKGETSHS